MPQSRSVSLSSIVVPFSMAECDTSTANPYRALLQMHSMRLYVHSNIRLWLGMSREIWHIFCRWYGRMIGFPCSALHLTKCIWLLSMDVRNCVHFGLEPRQMHHRIGMAAWAPTILYCSNWIWAACFTVAFTVNGSLFVRLEVISSWLRQPTQLNQRERHEQMSET